MMLCRVFVPWLFVVIYGAGTAFSQFSSDVAQVLIPFTIEDRNHRLIDGLTKQDLRLFVDGREQRIDFVALEDGPASLLFVLDRSGSMKGCAADVREAVGRIVRAASADDEFGVVDFSDDPQVTVQFTAMPLRVQARVQTLTPGGSTSLTDAVVLAMQAVRRSHLARRAIIVISDGRENHSRHVRSAALRAAVESSARLYAIELYPPIGEGFGSPTMLEVLARATGGRYLPTVSGASIPSLIETIDIHRTYILGFTPPPEHRDGKLHDVEVSLRRGVSDGPVRLYWKDRYRVPALARSTQLR